jgi:hypothetical protein
MMMRYMSSLMRPIIPPHIVAEALLLRGLNIRWTGPITPTEMQYVEQYVLAMYPQYAGVVEGEKIDLSSLCIDEEPSEPVFDDRRKTPRGPFHTLFWKILS